MPKITTLELEIKQTITNSRNTALEKLATNLNTLKASVSGIEKDLGSVAGAFKAFSGSLENGNTMAANIKKCGAAIKKLIEDSKGADTAATGMAKIADQLERISNASGNASGIKSALSDINKAAATNGTRTKPAVDTGKGTTRITAKDLETEADKIPKVKTELKEATKASTSFGFSLSKAVASGSKLVDAGWDKLKAKVSGLLGPVTNLLHSFGRIAMYRGLRTAIKAITQGFSQGIEHLYEWAGLVDNRFKQSMDSIATSAHYLRDSLGAMASPLLDALAPALEILVDKFVSLLNVANQFFAALTGKDTWRKAVRTPTEWKAATDDATDSTKKATEAQKKLNKALMDFDEIHLLTTSTTQGSNPSSPSGSGNDSGIDSTHFEEVPIASWIQDIKDAIANGDWYGAGKLLADKLNGMLDSFDAKAFGEKIGEKVENGLKFYLGFMENFKWGTLGIKAGDFINGILSKIDPEDLGHALTAKVRAALSFLSNFAWTVDLSSLGTALGVAFNDLFSARTMKDLGLTISGFLNNAIHFAASFIGTADFGEAGKNLIDGLVTAITTTDWATAGTTLADFAISIVEFVGNALIEALNHLDDIVGAFMAFAGAFLEKIGDYIHEKFFGWADELNQWFADTFGTNGATGSSVPDSLVGDTSTPVQGKEYDWKVNITPTEDTLATGSWFDKFKGSIEEVNKTTYKAKMTDKDGTIKATATSAGSLVGAKGLGGLKSSYSSKVSVSGLSGAASNVEKLLQMGKLKKSYTTDLVFRTSVTTAKSGATGGTTKSLLTKSQLIKVLGAYAQGGFPSDDLTQGSLFVAGEMPGQAEMVGSINGKTGVASGKEITGIGDAVRETGAAEAELLREQNQLLRQILAKSGSVTLAPSAAAGRWVSQSQAAYARATGV